MPTFSLLTFNVFGVPAPGTSARLRTLARHLDAEDLTVVCLQEVQANPYRKLLMQSTRTYDYAAFEPFIHAPKGGLLTLSRAPLLSSTFTLYRERGLWYTPALADWILHKGLLVTRYRLYGQPIVVINTHLTANYMGNWGRGNAYAEHEHRQLMQLAEVVCAQSLDAIVIVAGDFNVPRGTWLYESFLQQTRLTDPLEGSHEPTLRKRTGIPDRYFGAIDYVLFRSPPLPGCRFESRRRFQEPVELSNGRDDHLSDHIGIEFRMSWQPAGAAPLA